MSLTFNDSSKKVEVKKDENLYGTIELTSSEKSFTSYGTKKFDHSEVTQIKDYLDSHDLE